MPIMPKCISVTDRPMARGARAYAQEEGRGGGGVREEKRGAEGDAVHQTSEYGA